MNRKISVSVAMAVTALAMTLTFAITMIVSMNVFDNTVSSVMEKQAFFSKISEVDKFVRGNFYGEIDDTYLQDRTARGYVEGISDPYSVYYTKDEYADLVAVANSELVDIGVEVIKSSNGYFQVLRVYSGSPAERAGLKTYGWITDVDGQDTSELASTSALKKLLRGRPGTTVSVTFVTDPAFIEEEVISIQRDNYAEPTVELTMQNGYAYIRISSITSRTSSEFDVNLRRAVTAEKAKGIVFDLRNFDLRNNAADQYAEVYKLINRVCPLGTIARVEDKNGAISTHATSDGDDFVDLPMVCIVNEKTAASAELFAACVRDLAGGQLVGVNTAGRGTMQNSPQKLSDGSALSITYGVLLAGTSGSFNGKGLKPDVEAIASNDTWMYMPDFYGDAQIVRALELCANLARQKGTETSDDSSASNSTSQETSAASSSQNSDDGADDTDDNAHQNDDNSNIEGSDTDGSTDGSDTDGGEDSSTE